MSLSVRRTFLVVLTAAVALSCAEDRINGVRRGNPARLAVAPSVQAPPAGGPAIQITRVRGVLKSQNTTDSTIAEGLVEGDSAILEFTNIDVVGDSSRYRLGVRAFDKNDVTVFEGGQDITVRPGDNAPAAPVLEYKAPDAAVSSIDIVVPAPGPGLALDWAGANPLDNSCQIRNPNPAAKTQQLLTVTGLSTTGQPVTGVRVGWTSLDTTVVTVDSTGLVKARCANRQTKVIARTYLNKADTINVTVTAPAYSLTMSPDSVDVGRGDSVQLAALGTDERNNPFPATAVTWLSSDTAHAKVNSTGKVFGFVNGRVLVTATAGGRSAIAVVRVGRPKAFRVVVLPGADTAKVSQGRQFVARALDSLNRVIGDATNFAWSSNASSFATVNATTGVATAVSVGTAYIIATIDGKKDSAAFRVQASLATGSVKSRVTDGQTGAVIANASITTSSGASATSAGDGTFTLANVQQGDNLSIAATGYVTATFFDAPALGGQTVQVPDVPLAPTSASPGTIAAKVVNALSGGGLSGLTVRVYSGLNGGPSANRPSVSTVTTTTTASDGTFGVSVPAGAYTLAVSGSGFAEAIGPAVSIGGTTTTAPNVLMPPTTAGSIYIVLTWGDCASPNIPCDLDAHLTGPRVSTESGRFHVYHGIRSYVSGPDTIAALDVDVNAGKGPEIIGLRPTAAPGLYHFYVHNYSDSSKTTGKALSDSSLARVQVYQDNKVVATFFPPAGQAGTLWNVFDYDGARIIPVGQIVADIPAILPSVILTEPPRPKIRR